MPQYIKYLSLASDMSNLAVKHPYFLYGKWYYYRYW